MDVSVEVEVEVTARRGAAQQRVTTVLLSLLRSRALRFVLLGVVVWLGLMVWGGNHGAGLGSQLHWRPLEARHGLLESLIPHRAAALGQGPGGSQDVHIGWIRSTPEGGPLSAWGVTNVSRSPGVDETSLVIDTDRLAYALPAGDGTTAYSAVELIILTPTRSAVPTDLSLLQRGAMAWTSLETWGQLSPPWRARVTLESPTTSLELRWQGPRLELLTDAGVVVVDPAIAAIADGEAYASLSEHVQGRPDLFRWAVDQLRYSRFVGPDYLQRLEHIYLELSDAYVGLAEEHAEPASPVNLIERLGRPVPPSREGGPPWPPRALTPILEPALESEGRWQERDSRFVAELDDAPPLLLTTFLRTDPERPNTSRVFMTAWNPEWLELGWVAGTMEPRSTVGLRGTGQVPEEALERLVAGFNGGFQAVDGAFGLKTRAGPFLPPVPYGATIAQLDNGRLGFGSWPESDDRGAGLVAYRQNLTALIEDGRTNPYGRRFWGGVPADLRDTTRTDRTGLCLTTEHHLIYFWGQRVTVDALARAMTEASCDYGMLLDINFSNTVFETYLIARQGQLPTLDRPLDDEWEHEGAVPGRGDLTYRVQAMAPGMTRVGFPRYIRTELRDFFYLALRPEAISPPTPSLCALSPLDDGTRNPPRAWRCELAREAEEELELFEFEASRVSVSLSSSGSEASEWLSWPVSFDRASCGGRASLILRQQPQGGTLVEIVDETNSVDLSEATVLCGTHFGFGAETQLETVSTTVAESIGLVVALGQRGEFVVGATSWSGAQSLREALSTAGFERAIFLPRGEERLSVSPDTTPMALRIFEDTQPVPQRVWGRLHRQAQERIDELGLTRQYVQIRHYRDRDRESRR